MKNGRNLFYPNPLPVRQTDRVVLSVFARDKTTGNNRDPAVVSLSFYGIFH
jgi:hypothetical protein